MGVKVPLNSPSAEYPHCISVMYGVGETVVEYGDVDVLLVSIILSYLMCSNGASTLYISVLSILVLLTWASPNTSLNCSSWFIETKVLGSSYTKSIPL